MRFYQLATCGLFAFAACGGDDAPPGVTPSPQCDFTEAADATNDAIDNPEMSGFTDVGNNGKTLCGKVDAGHFADGTVDSDRFRITVASSAVLVHFAGGNGVDTLASFSVQIYTTATHAALVAEKVLDVSLSDHATFLQSLPPADYDIVVTASGDADIASSVDYKVQILPDTPDRCPKSADPVDYAEANDGADNTGNDGFTINWMSDPSVVAAAGPAEATGLAIAPTTKAHITGMSGNTNSTDDYMDQDSYSFTTGDSANEMSIRVSWAGAADLDYAVIEDGQTAVTQESDIADEGGDEFATFALKANTPYVLWVGSVDGSTGLPMAYDVSICGSGFQY